MDVFYCKMSPAPAVTGGRLQFCQEKQDQALLADACISAGKEC